MKNKSAILGLLFVVLVTVVAYGIYGFFLKTDRQVVLDNPTPAQLEVQIDRERYVLAAWQSVDIDLPLGVHRLSLKSPDSLKIDTTFYLTSDQALINPTRSPYYIFEQYYGPGSLKDSVVKNKSTVLDGETYLGEVVKTNQLCVDDFYINVHQDYPSVVKVDSFQTFRKIFRASAFKRFYKENYP